MPYMFSIDSIWREAADDQTNIAWTREFWKRMEPHFHHGRIYLSFPGLGEEGERLLRDSFGPNYAPPAGDQAEIRSGQPLPLQPEHSAGCMIAWTILSKRVRLSAVMPPRPQTPASLED